MIGADEELWGPDAAEFDPDRFLDERKKYILANPFIFVPFNAGPRICLGQQAIPPEARVPQHWIKGRGRKAMEGFRPKVVLTMACEGGMWLKANPVERG
ncbi:hypothetical protein D9611_008184 [Ephemerocybe angulata]|uniref:Cytochrome P450 n=1 Tax=Ephemerocybe angulata TaxID=980116 RepID=A0A8H5FCS1_9AGAR|nr:hypothetical protein D9611_008184 [Tulosesus angulatus]